MSPLFSDPQPLIDSDKRIIVLWSAKSACTMTYVWFSSLCGFLDEVRSFDDWPHNHRTKVFRLSQRYRESRRADTSGYHVVKIIRDPYSRAVSIFRHAIRNRLVERDSISFRDFLRMLARLDMDSANMHFRPQFHAFERERKPDTIINISRADLVAELNTLETRMGWPVTDFAAMAWLRDLENRRRPRKLATNGERYFAVPVVRSTPPINTPFPDDEAFLTSRAERLIEQIYRADFEAYSVFL